MNIPTPLRLLLLGISPPCDEITFLASKAMDTDLTVPERWRLKFHFLICTGCRRFNIQIHTLHSTIHEVLNATEESLQVSFVMQQDIVLSAESRQRMQKAIATALNEAP